MYQLFKYFIITTLSLITLQAYALKTPKAFAYDQRIRYVDYNPHDVVQIETVIGIVTHLALQEGEQYITHAFGDAKAWSFTNQDHHYFLKPREQDADTNLTIITDRRTYYLRLRYHAERQTAAMYSINFVYNDAKTALANKNYANRLVNPKRDGYNLNYTMSGDTDIAPINTWDNNEFTYFKFAAKADLPGIYLVDAAGTESIVNRHVMADNSNVIVVHKINHKWLLRLGNRALAVYNDAYNNSEAD